MAKAGTERVLLASAARTATGNGSAECGFGRYEKFSFQLDITVVSGTTPTLDVVVQHSIDGGTNWFTLVTFTQKTATGEFLMTESEVESGTAEAYGDCFRVSYTIGGTTPSFTFSVRVFAQDAS